MSWKQTKKQINIHMNSNVNVEINNNINNFKLKTVNTNNSSYHQNTPEKYREKSRLDSPKCSIKQIAQKSRRSYSPQEENPQQLHQLEIKQLKRQNAFLKKKLEDAINQKRQLLLQGFGIFKPKKKLINRGLKKPKKQEIQVSMQFFFKQIGSLITSVAQVYNISLYDENQQDQYLSKSSAIQKSQPKRSNVMKKQELYQKLQKISLDLQQKRYPALLNVFTDYYRSKTEAEKSISQFVDSMTQKTLELNQWLIQKARKDNQQKSECHKSVQLNDFDHDPIQDVKSDKKFIAPFNSQIISQTPKVGYLRSSNNLVQKNINQWKQQAYNLNSKK